MRYLTAVAALLALATTALASNPDTKMAFGMAPLDRGASIWLTLDKTWVGVEIDRLEKTWSESPMPEYLREQTANPPSPRDAVQYNTQRTKWSVTAKQFLLTGEKPLMPIRYLLPERGANTTAPAVDF